MTFGMQNSEAEAHQQLSCAWDEFGINFLDVSMRAAMVGGPSCSTCAFSSRC